MSDLKIRVSSQRPRRAPSRVSRHSTAPEEGDGLDDLSAFGDEELIQESKREAIRRSQDNRQAAQAQRDLDEWERLTLVRLLVFCAGVAALASLVGMLTLDSSIIKAGLAALCAAAGLGFYRLRDVLRR